jgi:hypothetical protein
MSSSSADEFVVKHAGLMHLNLTASFRAGYIQQVLSMTWPEDGECTLTFEEESCCLDEFKGTADLLLQCHLQMLQAICACENVLHRTIHPGAIKAFGTPPTRFKLGDFTTPLLVNDDHAPWFRLNTILPDTYLLPHLETLLDEGETRGTYWKELDFFALACSIREVAAIWNVTCEHADAIFKSANPLRQVYKQLRAHSLLDKSITQVLQGVEGSLPDEPELQLLKKVNVGVVPYQREWECMLIVRGHPNIQVLVHVQLDSRECRLYGTTPDMLLRMYPEANALEVLKQIASALVHCHERGILHRYVCTDAIRVTFGNARYLLADFRHAVTVQDAREDPPFVSAFRPAEVCSAATDVYGLAMVVIDVHRGFTSDDELCAYPREGLPPLLRDMLTEDASVRCPAWQVVARLQPGYAPKVPPRATLSVPPQSLAPPHGPSGTSRAFTREEFEEHVASLCDAVLALHKMGIIHRGLNETSIGFTSTLQIVEFETACPPTDASAWKPRTRLPMTSLYQAPELAFGLEPDFFVHKGPFIPYNSQVDVWSIAMLYVKFVFKARGSTTHPTMGLVPPPKMVAYVAGDIDLPFFVKAALEVNPHKRSSLHEFKLFL